MNASEFWDLVTQIIGKEETLRAQKIKQKQFAEANMHGDRAAALRELRDAVNEAGGLDLTLQADKKSGFAAGEYIAAHDALALRPDLTQVGLNYAANHGKVKFIKRGLKDHLYERASLLAYKKSNVGGRKPRTNGKKKKS